MAYDRIANIHSNMMSRCYNRNFPAYEQYGRRGIMVCTEWKILGNFRKWAMQSGYSSELSLERKENNEGYNPDNCCWATRIEQCNNTRRNVYLDAFGERKTIAEWARDPRCVVTKYTLAARIKNGWVTLPALTLPLFSRKDKELI